VIANIKLIFEVISLILDGLKFIQGEISEHKYTSAVKKRKENYDKFIAGSRSDRLDVLRDENEED
jgi:hypothetical protein|tara:strand:+ start:945 stop:1139 length:195 start_codon:yes stop_codon:yes gene_type:complete